jgi:hypothetical protein
MANAPAVLAFVLLAATTAALLQWFADRRVPAHVLITTWLCWFMSFSIVLMIPLDVAAALGNGDGGGQLGATGLRAAWRVVYWGSFMMMTLVLGTQQSYCDSGAFTVRDRLREAIRANLLYYAVLMAIGVGQGETDRGFRGLT